MILMIQFSEKGSFFSCCIVHILGSRKKCEGGEGMVQGSWIRVARERRLV
jgi:hypothetical protein